MGLPGATRRKKENVMNYAIRIKDNASHLYWNSTGWTDNKSTAQLMTKTESETKLKRMIEDGIYRPESFNVKAKV